MKTGTENKLKFKQLQRILDLDLWKARGLLDTLWSFVAHNCPAGDIGQFTDEEIAIGIDWRTDASELIKTLVSVRWLDEHPEHRLIVHDWPEHCEDGVHKSLARRVEVFADGSIPSLSRFTKDERTQLEVQYRVKYGKKALKNGGKQRTPTGVPERTTNAPALPSLTIPNHTKPSPTKPSNATHVAFEKFWNVFPSTRKGGRREALKAFESALKRRDTHGAFPTPEILIAAAEEYAASPAGQGQFASGPAPWLNKERWNDDRQSWQEKINKPVHQRAQDIPGLDF